MNGVCINKKWNRITETIYIVMLTVFVFLYIIHTSVIQVDKLIPGARDVLFRILYIRLPLFVGVIYGLDFFVSKRYKEWKNMLAEAVVMAAFAMATLHTLRLFSICVFVICARFTTVKKIAWSAVMGIISATLLIMALSVTPGMDWLIVDILTYERMGRTAHALGFGHYALWARQILWACIFYLFARGKKTSWGEIAVISAVFYGTFYLSTQRLTFVVSILVIAIFVLVVKCGIIKINNKLFRWASTISFTVSGVAMILAHWFYSPENAFLVKINKFLNTRLSVGSQAFEKYEIKLFGQRIVDTIEPYFYIDCGFMHILFEAGVVIYVITIVAFSYLMWRACVKNDTTMFMCTVALLVYMMIDNAVLNLSCCGIVGLMVIPTIMEHLQEKRLQSKL